MTLAAIALKSNHTSGRSNTAPTNILNHTSTTPVNPKALFITMLAFAALGYYAYDPELTLINKLTGKTAPAKTAKAQTAKAKKGKSKPAAATPAPAAETEPETEVTPPPADEPSAVATAPEPEVPAEPEKPKGAPAGSARVADVLASLPLLKEVTPNSEARYYIYLMSAGWCGPCNQEMPHIVKTYEDIKASGVAEIILIDFDDKPEAALAYMDKYGATFPAVMQDNAAVLPGIQPPGGIPSAIIVDEMGNILQQGHGSITHQWRKVITEYEEKNGLPSSLSEAAKIDDTPEAGDKEQESAENKKAARNLVARAAGKVKWASGRPSKKAKYYIYLQSASWCGPCQAEMPHIAEEYKEMKKDGRVELLLISGDRTEGAAKNFLKANKATFPMTLSNAKGVTKLPGFTMAQGIPHAIIVNSAGEVLVNGHGSIVKDWRKHTIDKEK